MNLTRSMNDLAAVYGKIQPTTPQKPQAPVLESVKQYASNGDRNAQMLNEIYGNIAKQRPAKQLNEAVDEPGQGPEYRQDPREIESSGVSENEPSSREKLILNAINVVADTYQAGDEWPELTWAVDTEVLNKTGKGLSDQERDMVSASLKRLLKQEDEIDVVKSDINKDNKLSGYEKARGGAIDKAMGGSGKMPKGEHVSEAKKSNSAKKTDKKANKKKADTDPYEIFKQVKLSVLKNLRKEKFELFGAKNQKHLMNATNYKPQAPKGFKVAGSKKKPVIKSSGKSDFQNLPKVTDKPPGSPFIKNSGPKSTGVEIPQEPLEPSKKVKGDNVYEVNKFSQGVKKINERNINTDMSKSIFDKLFEDVMADDDAAALGATDADLGDVGGDLDMGAEEDLGGEDVTITLPRDVAQQFYDALGAMLAGGEEGLGDEGEGLEGDLGDEAGEGEEGGEMGEEDNEEKDDVMGEEIEAEELGHPLVNQKKGTDLSKVSSGSNKVASEVTKLAKSSKGGDGKVTDKVGNDGDEGHPLVNQKKGTELANPKGKGNVVKSTVSSKAGDTFFQAN